MKFLKEITAVEWGIIAVILMLLVAMAVPVIDKVSNRPIRDQQAYAAWCQLNRRTDISFEQWQLLRRENLLYEKSK